MTENKTAFPLCWPERRPRIPRDQRRTNGQFKTSFAAARDACMLEIKRLGGSQVIVSSNVPLKRDGQPQAVDWGKALPTDNAVAVYFRRNGKELCFACDRWAHVQDNMHAISLTIEALRGIARWGTGDMMEAAFRGYAALPGVGETGGAKWWEVLGVTINATFEQGRDAYRKKAMELHPDQGGSTEEFIKLQAAWQQFEQLNQAAA